MYYLIYKITNNINNKIYIGKHQTENKDDDYMGSGTVLKKAIEKYGLDKFTKEILFECNSLEEMNQKEAEIVDEEFVARFDTYNIKLGGQGGWDYCNNNSEMQSLKAKNNWNKYGKNHPVIFGIQNFWKSLTDEEYIEYIEKISNGLQKYYHNHPGSMKGRHLSKESKDRIGKANSIKQRGESNSHYGKCWIYNDKLKENKSIKREDIDKWINMGWKKGRKMKF